MHSYPHRLHTWGLLGAFFAFVFAIWMLFFPDAVAPYFAWDVHPRLAQAFIAAGYIFRTGFFLSVWREQAWHRVRWIFWGNLVFTAALLLATFWHAEEFKWAFPLSTGHLWLFLYVGEPLAMIFMKPRGEADTYAAPRTGGPIQGGLKLMLALETGFLGAVGSLLVINPAFANRRWPWELNPLDARIMAAWFLGWSVWAATMYFAQDWDEIRIPAQLNLLFGLALLVVGVIFFPLLNTRRSLYFLVTILFTLAMAVFYWRQERARPTVLDRTGAPRPVI